MGHIFNGLKYFSSDPLEALDMISNKLLRICLLVVGLCVLLGCDDPRRKVVNSLSDGVTGKIYYKSSNPYCYNHILEPKDNDKQTTVFGVLKIPKSSEPQVGAIIYVHGSGGWVKSHEHWLQAFYEMGVATFRLNSFKPRDISSTVGSQIEVTSAMMTADAYNALKLLSTHPRIDKQRIGIMGSSKGGTVTLVSAWEPVRKAMVDGKLKFALHIALYPFCYGFESVQMTGAPILTLFGEKDDWTSAATCVDMTNSLKSAGFDANIILYPNAYHAFDSDRKVEYLKSGFNTTECRAIIQSDGLAIEMTSGLPMDQPDQLKKMWETCTTRGVHYGKNSLAKEKSMDEIIKFVTTLFKL